MRKLLFLLFCYIFLFGCSKPTVDPDLDSLYSNYPYQDLDLLYSNYPYLKPFIEAEQIKIYPDSLLAEQTMFDIDRDGIEEQIEMYIYPAPIKMERDGASAEWGWDDSHLWQLIVRDGENIYPLYNYGPHFTMLKFWIYDKQDTPEIILMLESYGGIIIYSYSFDSEKQHYKQTMVYTVEGQRSFSSSFPD